jgi:hypothetical protein
MTAREAQTILQQEVARRQAVEYLVTALETAAVVEETRAAKLADIAALQEQETKAKAEVAAAWKAAKLVKEKTDADMRNITAEYTARVTKAHNEAEAAIAQFQAKKAEAEEAYNKRMVALSDWEAHEQILIKENIAALQDKLGKLQNQIEAEESRLEAIRQLREQLQKV